jgi:hypothetical protein
LVEIESNKEELFNPVVAEEVEAQKEDNTGAHNLLPAKVTNLINHPIINDNM